MRGLLFPIWSTAILDEWYEVLRRNGFHPDAVMRQRRKLEAEWASALNPTSANLCRGAREVTVDQAAASSWRCFPGLDAREWQNDRSPNGRGTRQGDVRVSEKSHVRESRRRKVCAREPCQSPARRRCGSRRRAHRGIGDGACGSKASQPRHQRCGCQQCGIRIDRGTRSGTRSTRKSARNAWRPANRASRLQRGIGAYSSHLLVFRPPSQAGRHGFESRRPLFRRLCIPTVSNRRDSNGSRRFFLGTRSRTRWRVDFWPANGEAAIVSTALVSLARAVGRSMFQPTPAAPPLAWFALRLTVAIMR